MTYDHKTIESKWQKTWAEQGLYHAKEAGDKDKKYYVLDMFPYPSGAGLHVGHPKGYIATDILARYKMLNGCAVLHPMGWDAFGLPAENDAIKNHAHPRISTEQNIQNYKRQLSMLGLAYDWTRELNTTDPQYYHWTQWAFLQMFNKGLVYESSEPINWCPSCKTGLANEDLEDGKCERCGSVVERKPIRQIMIRITDYADRLLSDLELLPDWDESVKEMQRNWIGKSTGAEVIFQIKDTDEQLEVFTTRSDTLYGCTYMVVCPEHELITKLKDRIKNYQEVAQYQEQTKRKSDLERTDLNKDKTGVMLEGIQAVNPINQEVVPIFVADYVLAGYGTGAIMAVPAHDQRDWEFATKYNLPIRQVVTPDLDGFNITVKSLQALQKIHEAAQKENIQFWLLGGLACAFHARTIYRAHDDLDLIAKDQDDYLKLLSVFEKLGYKKINEKKLTDKLTNSIFQNQDGIEIDIGPFTGEWDIQLSDLADNEIELNGVRSRVVSKRFVELLKKKQVAERNKEKDRLDWEYLNGKVYTESGQSVNSELINGLDTAVAQERIVDWLRKNKLGEHAVNYKLCDWVFSRQRYWGEPIPLIHCDKCGLVGLSEKDLPLQLPEVENYEPSGTGESPLAIITDWVNTTCPKCGGPAKRETNTMPQWAGSCWYYLRYMDPRNPQALVDKKLEQFWSPVDYYVGGAEHVTRHMIYARFWHKFLYDLGVVSTKEPFAKYSKVGLILAEDGRKMSKRWNNVINPDEIVERYGADALRVYEMFMGPFEQAIAWNTNGLVGARKFLEKISTLKNKVDGNYADQQPALSLLHKTIKKVSNDIQGFKFNTAVSALMILVNLLTEQEKISKQIFESLLLILSPFAPHLAEELWHELGHADSIFRASWPQAEEKYLRDDQINLVVQVNGKLRATILVDADINEVDAKAMALQNPQVQKWLDGKQVAQAVFVKGRLINFVLK